MSSTARRRQRRCQVHRTAHPHDRALWAPYFAADAMRRRDAHRQATGLQPEGWRPVNPVDLLAPALAKQALSELADEQGPLLGKVLDGWARWWLRGP